MDDVEWKVYYKFFATLCRDIETSALGIELLGKGLISTRFYKSVVFSKESQAYNNTVLLENICRHCTMDEFLTCLRDANYGQTADDISEEVRRERACVWKTPHYVTMTYRDDALDKFAERVKIKVHNAEATACARDFRLWIARLLSNLKDPSIVPREEKRLADFCFVLLDTLVVLERTHSQNRQCLFQKDEYSQMKSVIMSTSNPTLMRIRYNGRYGMALAHSGQLGKALDHLQSALDDAQCYSAGKDIGNLLFAIVNVKLLMYSLDKSLEMKQEILSFIENAVRYFDNEEEEVLLNWRRTYLVKKAYCHLGIDSCGKDIIGAIITISDLEKASECLNSLETIISGIDIRRKMHLYRAKAKLHSLREEQWIADGYLNQALALAHEGNFLSDIKILEEVIPQGSYRQDGFSLKPTLRSFEPALVKRGEPRVPLEHDETSSVEHSLPVEDDVICECPDYTDVEYSRSNYSGALTPTLDSDKISGFEWIQHHPVGEMQPKYNMENTNQSMGNTRQPMGSPSAMLSAALSAICRLLHIDATPFDYQKSQSM